MTNAQMIEAVNHWQTKVNFHPLTCGNDSSHTPLYARERPAPPGPDGEPNGDVVLYCEDCDYVQAWIPEIVLETYMALVRNPCPGCGKTVDGSKMWWGKEGKAWHVECYFGTEVPPER